MVKWHSIKFECHFFSFIFVGNKKIDEISLKNYFGIIIKNFGFIPDCSRFTREKTRSFFETNPKRAEIRRFFA